MTLQPPIDPTIRGSMVSMISIRCQKDPRGKDNIRILFHRFKEVEICWVVTNSSTFAYMSICRTNHARRVYPQAEQCLMAASGKAGVQSTVSFIFCSVVCFSYLQVSSRDTDSTQCHNAWWWPWIQIPIGFKLKFDAISGFQDWQ